jgi:hypothetical protein
MSNEKMRQDFEEWCCNADNGPLVDPVWIAYFDAETNEYGLNQIQRDWKAWQASRAALCVELPHIGDYIDTYKQGDNRDAYLADLRDAIESTGVRVK